MTGQELKDGKDSWMGAMAAEKKAEINWETAARIATEREEQRLGAERLAGFGAQQGADD